MAQYTPNYGLHQWEPGDNFLRTDFNQDFAKIDTAVKQVSDAKADKSALTALESVVSGKSALVVGAFTGNGGTQEIHLGFRPKAVLVGRFGNSTLALDGYSNNDITVTGQGFSAKYVSGAYVPVNRNGDTYLYLAVR